MYFPHDLSIFGIFGVSMNPKREEVKIKLLKLIVKKISCRRELNGASAGHTCKIEGKIYQWGYKKNLYKRYEQNYFEISTG